MHAGVHLFVGAVMAVLRRPIAAVKIAWFPFLIGLAAIVWAGRQDDPEALVPLVVTFVVDTLMVAFVAVGWHRFRLLDDQPGLLGARTEPSRLLRYALEWFILGLIIGFVIFVLAAVVLVAGYLLGEGSLVTHLMDSLDSGEFALFDAIVVLLTIWGFTWGFFRIATGLPALAIHDEDNRPPRLGSWWVTAAQEPAIVVCSGLAALGTLALFAPTMWAYDVLPDSFIFVDSTPDPGEVYRFSLKFQVLSQLCWTLITLFGASILTEIYRASGSHGPSGEKALQDA